MTKAPDLFRQALQAMNAGDLQGAERTLRKVIRADARHGPALNMLAVILMHLNRFAEAEPLIARAVEIDSRSDVSYYNLGLIAKALNKPVQALDHFGKALAINPNVAETWNNRGTIFNNLRRHHEAIADFDRAIALNPSYTAAFANKGKSLAETGRHDEAIAHYLQALSMDPRLIEAWIGLGNVFSNIERYDEALSACDRALALNANSAETWSSRGAALRGLKRNDDALAAYAKARTLDPGLAEAWLGFGNILFDRQDLDAASAAYDKAIALAPDLAEAWLGRGNVAVTRKRPDDALVAFDKALTIKTELAEAWHGRGTALFALNRDAEALAGFDKAISLKPDLAASYVNKALLKLSAGDYDEGWRLHEWRWKKPASKTPLRDFGRPLWLGEPDIAGKTILVHAEQGLGDTIQFSRYVELLAKRGGNVLFQVQPPLAPLFRSQTWPCDVVSTDETLPPFDLHCPLLTLPLAFKTTLETIPSKAPYIVASPEKITEWENRIGKKDRPRIGLAWSGNPLFAGGHDVARPIGLPALRSIFSDDFSWYRLQTDIRDADKSALDDLPAIADFSSSLKDFSDTAALIAQIDLVISIDTSVAHLAGAMGKPVWILLPFHPDFRWLRERSDSPWYPTARLFRQPAAGDWAGVLRRVADDLTRFKPQPSQN